MKVIVLVSVFVCLWWSAKANFDANCYGTRTTMVHLFEWRWADIAEECERFLSKKGFCGVQVSPPNEHRVVSNDKYKRPWWERYQPVSYKIYTRSGDEDAFVDMVTRCNNVGVRVYVDAVLNHMASDDAGQGIGIAGTSFNTDTLDFPGVPYSTADFHQKGKDCKSASGNIESYQDVDQVRNCRLVGLVDLNQRKATVRTKIVEYLNKLIGFGVAGFRFDAAKHMWPEDLQMIITNLDRLNAKWFQENTKPFIYQEVIDLGVEPIKSSEYYEFARVTEFNYGKFLSQAFSGRKLLSELQTFGEGFGYLMPADKALVFIDNHDNQRGHGAGGAILNFFSPRQYKMAVAFMLAWPYGQARVMSSYKWDRDFQDGFDQNNWVGPPTDENYNIKPVTINDDGSCGSGWVCEHRWRSITNMAKFRNVVGSARLEKWWDDGFNQIAFSRGERAFFAMNGGTRAFSESLPTGLKPGVYCDVISGERTEDGKSCTGKSFTVDSDGKVHVDIAPAGDEPMIAIHIDSKVNENPEPEPETTTLLLPSTNVPVTTSPVTSALPESTTSTTTTTHTPTPTPEPTNYKRTVVFIKYHTNVGQYMWTRGGISKTRRPACEALPSNCYIPLDYSQNKYNTPHYDSFNAWSKGDHYLDWDGAEPGQGTYKGWPALGTPMAWTTNAPTTHEGYNPLNTYEEHLWMLDVMMDCSATESGWFEVKGYMDELNPKWEPDVKQISTCNGNAPQKSKPYDSEKHFALCGHKNVFYWGNQGCIIDTL